MNKNDLRKFYTQLRNGINPSVKISADRNIFSYFVNSGFFTEHILFLCYVSVNSEVDTRELISYLLKNTKRVAVPFCINDNMLFCEISSLDDLEPGRFNIPTPKICEENIITNFADALCVVPALSYDVNGNRLGYGGGYYDRFLKKYNVKTLGLAYSDCICQSIPTENSDVKIKTVLTENGFNYYK